MWAQQRGSADGPPPPAPSAAPIDIDTLDPHAYRAIAYRLREGEVPKIDGRLDEPVWQLAHPQGHFIQREPQFGYPASEPTEFRVLYDDKMLYIGVWVWDSDPSGIMGSEMKRDAGLSKGDQLKIDLDTFHDHRNAYYFSTNPLGAYKDANSVENGRTINYDWDAVWHTRTSIDDKGWYVEIEIPLSQLRFRSSVDEVLWGMNVCRILFRKNEESYWVPFPREWGAMGFARVSNAGVLAGLRNLRARRRLEFVPYVLPRAERDYVTQPKGEFASGYGADLRVGITQEITADFTYHTDFAQVEADQEIINLTRFSLFFPEKRQFFTESAGIFDFGKAVAGLTGEPVLNAPGLLALYYSRRIGLVDGHEVPIVGGGRVTGHAGGYTFGVLNVSTARASLDAERTVDDANFTVVRLRRNVLAKSSVGALLLDSHGGISDYNRTLGLDAGLVLGQRVAVTALFGKTQSSPSARAGAATGKDTAAVVDFMYKSDAFNYGAQVQDIAEHFNAEMGYIPRLNIRAGKARAGWTPRPKWKGVRQLMFTGTADYFEDHAGRVDSKTQEFEAHLQQQNTSNTRVILTREYDHLTSPFATAGATIPVGSYAWQTASFIHSSDRTKPVFGVAQADVGGYYDGSRRSVKLNLNVQVGKTLLFEPNWTHNRVRLPGRPLYVSNVVNFRVSHSFSPDFYLKGFVQYNDDRKTASFNFLWWYHYRPGSDLYVVYNQGWDIGLPLTSHELASSRVRARSLAVKLTYWLAR